MRPRAKRRAADQERAALSGAAGPQAAGSPETIPGDPISMVALVRSQTGVRLKKLRAEVRRASDRPADAERIHDLRVAIRRLTECLREFQEFFDPAHVKKIRKRLRKLMERCGAARSYDIALKLLEETGVQDHSLASALKKRRRNGERKMIRLLDEWRDRKTPALWRKQLQPARLPGAAGRPKKTRERPAWDANAAAVINASRVLPAMAQMLLAQGSKAIAAEATYRQLHKFRLATKRFRYTLELFEPLYGSAADGILRDLRALQDHLGGINDCVTSLLLVKGNRRASTALGRLMSAREREFRIYWRAAQNKSARGQWQAALAAAS